MYSMAVSISRLPRLMGKDSLLCQSIFTRPQTLIKGSLFKTQVRLTFHCILSCKCQARTLDSADLTAQASKYYLDCLAYKIANVCFKQHFGNLCLSFLPTTSVKPAFQIPGRKFHIFAII